MSVATTSVALSESTKRASGRPLGSNATANR